MKYVETLKIMLLVHNEGVSEKRKIEFEELTIHNAVITRLYVFKYAIYCTETPTRDGLDFAKENNAKTLIRHLMANNWYHVKATAKIYAKDARHGNLLLKAYKKEFKEKKD